MSKHTHFTSITPFEQEHKHPDCGCRLLRDENNGNVRFYQCAKHSAAPDLLEACKRQHKHLHELNRLTRAIDLTCHPDARNLVAALTSVIRLAISDHQSADAAIAKATT